ncbi:hypothetical protein CC86DRAFT_324930 [Ophiobolus disseminans]|uniref:Heterokaryon incompatibility domain-containing protein n=1 Tax=Ophiobolus disseminans TaxID=1469910 RepID=A0A6A6ZYI7_9PLEO|nr:hypothetical protein CC86DRAFT_324930 [Ophiobolus disseminans]
MRAAAAAGSIPARSDFAIREKARKLKQSLNTYKRAGAVTSDETEAIVSLHDSQSTISTTRNLDAALRHLRYGKSLRVVWIDALCINQSSTDEKNKQVAAMGEIYSMADRVIMWLGIRENGSDKALHIIELMTQYVEMDWDKSQIRSSHKCPDREKHWGDLTANLPFYSGTLNPVLTFFEKSYFKRLWIRQETALARFSVVQCGTRIISGEKLRIAAACFYRKIIPPNSVRKGRFSDFSVACRSLYQVCLPAGRISYHYLRHFLGDAKCRDPRDRIYAISALLFEEDKLLDIKADYSLDVEKLYMEVARRLISRDKNLVILDSCVLSVRALDVPSWTPDWSTSMPSGLSITETNWSASGWITSQISMQNDRLVRASGMAVRTVCEVVGTIVEHVDDAASSGYAEIIRILRCATPTAEHLTALEIARYRWTEIFCSSLFCRSFRESELLLKRKRLDFASLVEVTELVQSSALTFEEMVQETTLPLENLLISMHHDLHTRAVFLCNDGSAGFSFPGVQEGDIVSVLFGCRFPVLLRPASQGSPSKVETWEVVSTAVIAGLMEGEAIYGDKLPLHWFTLEHGKKDAEGSYWIDGHRNGFYDSKSQTLETNPAKILTDMGIKVESYQRRPHRLEVLPETLRAAGIPLREFLLA